MAEVVIEARNLGKRYLIGHQRTRRSYVALRDVIAGSARSFIRKAGDMARGRPIIAGDELEEVWAIRDLDFEVRHGQVMGIIGRNGAGKSTLLKVLSRITEPTTGSVRIHGRVASLLEIGTGFHPELTGRENIFLNGAILGMTRAEISRKFDEIVAFAEVERFLDTPVKRYSSGMYVRLAFAVAAHLELEILIVDEVLAVGDAKFQAKCLGKMQDVASASGRSVIFVSHNMGAISKLCSHAVLMNAGRIVHRGEPMAAISRYLSEDALDGAGTELNLKAADHPFTLISVEVLDAAGNPATLIGNHEPFRVRLTYELGAAMQQLRVGFRLHAQDSTVVLSTTNCDGAGELPGYQRGRYASEVEFPARLLNRGSYYLWIGVDIPLVCGVLSVERAASFSIEAVTGMIGEVDDGRLGVIAPLLPWSSRRIST